jgi:microcystin-dependent protein
MSIRLESDGKRIASALLAMAMLQVLPLATRGGDLDAPATPDSPTSAMYTLEAIYNRLDSGTGGVKRTGAFVEPDAAPGSTGVTLEQVMDKAPIADNADGAEPSDVTDGKAYWGLTDGAWGPQVGVAAGGGGDVLVGEVRMWAGAIAAVPDGWLFCNGGAVSRETYAELFAVVSTIYGSGDGSTTFNLPDLRDRSPMGARQDDSGVPKSNVSGSLSQVGGAATHELQCGEMPVHSHGVYLTHPDSQNLGGSGGWRILGTPTDHVDGVTSIEMTPDETEPHNNLPPYFAITYIIRY